MTSVAAVAYLVFLAPAAAFMQPGACLLVELCTIVGDADSCLDRLDTFFSHAGRVILGRGRFFHATLSIPIPNDRPSWKFRYPFLFVHYCQQCRHSSPSCKKKQGGKLARAHSALHACLVCVMHPLLITASHARCACPNPLIATSSSPLRQRGGKLSS